MTSESSRARSPAEPVASLHRVLRLYQRRAFFVDSEVILRHSTRRKSFFKGGPTSPSVDRPDLLDRRDGVFKGIYNEARSAVLHYFRNRAISESDNRSAAGQSLNQNKPEGLGPITPNAITLGYEGLDRIVRTTRLETSIRATRFSSSAFYVPLTLQPLAQHRESARMDRSVQSISNFRGKKIPSALVFYVARESRRCHCRMSFPQNPVLVVLY